MIIRKLDREFGPNANNELEHVNDPAISGAIAALESFYYSFNNKDMAMVQALWLNNDLIQLNNPIGGIVRGVTPLLQVYDRIFNGQANVWVRFTDIVCYDANDMVLFAGTEIGEFSTNNKIVPLQIRTSRIFAYIEDKKAWFQIHHHGSIDDPALLARYQAAVKTHANTEAGSGKVGS
jgi:SnoaL-like protein